MAEFFRRVEKKYMLTRKQHEQIVKEIKNKMIGDPNGMSTICNIYFDSPQYDLIRKSIEKPVYKDKVRIRSYNIPNKNSEVYLEIKRKLYGVVSKRRIEIKLNDAESYISGVKIKHKDVQVLNELDYYFKLYNLIPVAYISYDRSAYYSKDDKNFRVTFDNNITARTYDLKLENGIYGQKILNDDNYIMEVKTLKSMPLWFVKNIISKLEIQPCKYSKYGEAYKNIIMKKEKSRRLVNYV